MEEQRSERIHFAQVVALLRFVNGVIALQEHKFVAALTTLTFICGHHQCRNLFSDTVIDLRNSLRARGKVEFLQRSFGTRERKRFSGGPGILTLSSSENGRGK